MNKGDFVGAMLVQTIGSDRVMTLEGTQDEWVCSWTENGKKMSKTFKPEELEPAATQNSEKR